MLYTKPCQVRHARCVRLVGAQAATYQDAPHKAYIFPPRLMMAIHARIGNEAVSTYRFFFNLKSTSVGLMLIFMKLISCASRWHALDWRDLCVGGGLILTRDSCSTHVPTGLHCLPFIGVLSLVAA